MKANFTIVVAALIGYSLNITLGHDASEGLANSVLYRLYDHSADFCFTSFIETKRFTTQINPDTGEIFATIAKTAHYYSGTLRGGDDRHNIFILSPFYTPTHGRTVLISARGTVDRHHHVGGGIHLSGQAIGGAISDRIGRRAVLMGITCCWRFRSPPPSCSVADRRARLYPHDAGTAVVLSWHKSNGAMVGVNRSDALMCVPLVSRCL